MQADTGAGLIIFFLFKMAYVNVIKKKMLWLPLVFGICSDHSSPLWKTMMLFFPSYKKYQIGLNWKLALFLCSLQEWDGVLLYLYNCIFCDFFFLYWCKQEGKKDSEKRKKIPDPSHTINGQKLQWFFLFSLSFTLWARW